ncbi:unnamed protein product [Rhizoctonia solani]|uniref:Uncharacterized protein n=1 Tax=Rhizoctonia solani TaxID=456999 RepID=A0A8H3E911_9AGAM|nr:unnamed protein product [Rhizoctonia solani]
MIVGSKKRNLCQSNPGDRRVGEDDVMRRHLDYLLAFQHNNHYHLFVTHMPTDSPYVEGEMRDDRNAWVYRR